MREYINIAIDGPVASGKGAVSKGLSIRLGIPTLDTGAIYRGVTLYLLDNKIDINNEKAILLCLHKIDMRVFATENTTRIFLGNHDVSASLRDNTISLKVPTVSAYQGVRDYVNKKINEVTGKGDFILEGRDIGTAVLPNAKYKFYLTASVTVRAKRRKIELEKNNLVIPLVEMMAQIKERDQADMTRKVAPLKKADDAILIDNTEMDIEQTIDTIAKYIKL